MTIEFQDVLKANLVLVGVVLLGEQEQRDKFAEKVNTEITVEMFASGPVPSLPTVGSPAGMAETGLMLNLHKDRIQLISTPVRASIERQYPTFEDLDRLAQVASYAIDISNLEGQEPRAFGFNIDLVYRQSREKLSEKYIAERLFSRATFGFEEWDIVGGGGKISFESNNARWNFTVEPRANDSTGERVYLSLNLHKDKQETPDQEEILRSLQEVWHRSREFATHLDLVS